MLPPDVPGRQTEIFREALAGHDPRILANLGAWTLLTMSPLRVFFAGFEAVILFFALSGFVLSLPFWKDPRTPYGPFLVRRVFRIYVPYLGALALAVAGNLALSRGGIAGLNQWFNATWKIPIHPSTLLGNVALIASESSAFNTAFWSLVHEMRLSLVFPFLMLLAVSLGRFGILFPIPLFFLGCYIAPRISLGNLGESLEVLGIFFVGAYLAKIRHTILVTFRQWDTRRKWLFFLLSLSLYSFGWVWTIPAHQLGFNSTYKDLFIGAGAVGLIITSLGSTSAASLLRTKVCVALGRISYSLYLVHGTMLYSLVHILYGRASLWSIFCLYVFLSLLLAAVFWRWVENPSNRIGRNLAARCVAVPKGWGTNILRLPPVQAYSNREVGDQPHRDTSSPQPRQDHGEICVGDNVAGDATWEKR
jgi:peptidoglycan/LPS O-acetylase OafA/YrhL